MMPDCVLKYKSGWVRKPCCLRYQQLLCMIVVSPIVLLSVLVKPIVAIDCLPYLKIDDNDLTVNDIVIKGVETDLACVKARFALAFKISEKQPALQENGTLSSVLIGYVRIGNAISSQNNCPKDDNYNATSVGSKTFLMVVGFECGALEFKFERDEHRYSLAGISGNIRFGACK